jgi:hypothetical protein
MQVGLREWNFNARFGEIRDNAKIYFTDDPPVVIDIGDKASQLKNQGAITKFSKQYRG